MSFLVRASIYDGVGYLRSGQVAAPGIVDAKFRPVVLIRTERLREIHNRGEPLLRLHKITHIREGTWFGRLAG